MMGMNQLPLTYDQITFIMNQNPMIKNMVYTLIKNPMIMNQMMNIINVLYYNPLILEQIKNSITQEFMMNNQMLNMMDAMNNERMMMNNRMMNAMNNGGMMNHGMMNNFEDKQQNDISPITIYFRKGDEKPFLIQCLPTDKVSEVIERYRKKSGDNDDTLKFIYNSRALNPSITIGKAGITDNGNVSVVVTKNIMGG